MTYTTTSVPLPPISVLGLDAFNDDQYSRWQFPESTTYNDNRMFPQRGEKREQACILRQVLISRDVDANAWPGQASSEHRAKVCGTWNVYIYIYIYMKYTHIGSFTWMDVSDAVYCGDPGVVHDDDYILPSSKRSVL